VPIAYSYIRFSTPDQILGDSLRRQTEASHQYASEHGLTLDEKLNIRDLGVSAFKGSNFETGALGQFLVAIDDGRVAKDSFLLVESLDRLSRLPVTEALAIFQAIIGRGITIVTLIDSAIYSKERLRNDWTPLLVALVTMSRAHEESAVKSRRIKAAWEAKKVRVKTHKEVMSGRCPWWLKLSDDKTKYEIVEDKAAIVRLMFQLAKDGFGNTLIAKHLNEHSIPTAQHAKHWQNSTTGFNLSNIAVIGVLQLDQDNNGKTTTNTFIEDYYPPIIDKTLFYEVQAQRSVRNRNVNASIRSGRKGQCHNIFQGTARCGYCGGPVHIRRKPGINSGFLYCAKSLHGGGCIGVSYNVRDLETEFLNFTKELNFAKLIGSTSIDWLTQKQSELAACIGKLNELESKEKNLLTAIEVGMNIQSLVQRLREIDTQISESKKTRLALQSEIEALKHSETSDQSHIENVEELMIQLNSPENDLDAKLRLRFRLLTEVQKVVLRLDLYPGGILHTQDELLTLSNQLIEEGYDQLRVDAYLERMPVKPDRKARYFVAHLHNGIYRTVRNGQILEGGGPDGALERSKNLKSILAKVKRKELAQ
jgi:DNA invertase Pin-like site-specific DNA recombinase